jgi:DNA-binding response OmpR family regulator
VKIQCPGCGKTYRLADGRGAGGTLKVRCRACDSVFQVKAAEAPSTASAGGKRILVCDDALFFRTMVADVLKEAGFTVETAADGEETLALAPSFRPHLLIVDLQLPGMNGIEVIRRIRQEKDSEDLPILAMSGVFTDSSDVMAMEDAGADDYIGKKFKKEHLVKRVRRLLKDDQGGA